MHWRFAVNRHLKAGIKTAYVPCKSTNFALPDVIAEQIQFSIVSVPTVMSLAKAGRIETISLKPTTEIVRI